MPQGLTILDVLSVFFFGRGPLLVVKQLGNQLLKGPGTYCFIQTVFEDSWTAGKLEFPVVN